MLYYENKYSQSLPVELSALVLSVSPITIITFCPHLVTTSGFLTLLESLLNTVLDQLKHKLSLHTIVTIICSIPTTYRIKFQLQD